MIPKRRPIRWINRKGFVTRKWVIMQWLVLGNILILGYKSTLLSTLIPIRYESAIDSLGDMAMSGLSLIIPSATTIDKLISTDPRQTMVEIYKRGYFFSIPMNYSTFQMVQDR